MKPAVIGILAALLLTFSACSWPREDEARRKSGDGRPESPDRTTTTASDTAAARDYVALGDSLAAGVGANRGYVDRYAAHVASDTGARVTTVNLGVSGQTSSELLDALRAKPGVRRALGGAEIVTLNIGLNDLGRAGQAYADGSCGGVDGEACLREAVDTFGDNWDAIVAELADLGVTQDAVTITPGLGYVPSTNANLQPYVDEANRRISATASENGILHAEIRVHERGMSPDGVHPNDTGYAKIAQRLRELGYGTMDRP